MTNTGGRRSGDPGKQLFLGVLGTLVLGVAGQSAIRFLEGWPLVSDLILLGCVVLALLYLFPATRPLVAGTWRWIVRIAARFDRTQPVDQRWEEQVTVAQSRVIPVAGWPRVGYHLANTLTASRLLMAPLILTAGAKASWTVMYLLFLLANTTDVLDGLLARVSNGESASGKGFDATVDMVVNGGRSPRRPGCRVLAHQPARHGNGARDRRVGVRTPCDASGGGHPRQASRETGRPPLTGAGCVVEVGFEPTKGCPLPHFECGALGRPMRLHRERREG